MAITLPNPNINFISNGEPISPDVTNRPMQQINENLVALANQVGVTTPTVDAPLNPALGTEWTDQNGVPYLWNGTFWEPISGMFVQSTQPIHGRAGLFWYNDVNHVLYIYNGLYYMEYSSGGGSGGGTGGSSGGSLIAVPLVPTFYDISTTEGQTVIPFSQSSTDSILVFIDNIIVDLGVDYTYDLSNITFTQPFALNQKLKIIKFSIGSTSVNVGIKSTQIPVSVASTTFPYVQTLGSTSIVSIDGILNLTFHYDSSNIIFTDSVPVGVTISIMEITPSSTSISDSDAIASFTAIYPVLAS